MISKLRHPARALREPLGSAAIVISAITLLAALGGVAVASGGLSSKVKHEIKKYAKLYAKQFAIPGSQGPAGPQGIPGANGKNGTNGVDGKSVVVSTASCGGLGGAEVKQEGAASGVEVCNGEEGSPWSAGGTLPPGATEVGTWGGAFTANVSHGPEGGTQAEFEEAKYHGAEAVHFPISFPIPLAADIENAHVVKIAVGGTVPAECDDGVAPAASAFHPEADPGYLCVYVALDEAGVGAPNFILKGGGNGIGAGTMGAMLIRAPSGTTEPAQQYRGTFAVTG
jgi:hypothetical protein